MLRKCLCCGSKSRDEDDFKQNSREEQAREDQKKQESIERNTRILREDLYQNYMKPYFKLG